MIFMDPASEWMRDSFLHPKRPERSQARQGGPNGTILQRDHLSVFSSIATGPFDEGGNHAAQRRLVSQADHQADNAGHGRSHGGNAGAGGGVSDRDAAAPQRPSGLDGYGPGGNRRSL